MNRRTVQFRLNRLFVFYLNPMGEHESEALVVAVFARKRLMMPAGSEGFSWSGFS
ncbi:hypothetical protein JOC54_000050 [Alkalihalobacillus xiaoxiensis]|uniref:Uncharacterized protein n=1 Tax=Shouchella xiaoxiensis TaxID=766895 RepID=A0ABS2SMS4_9BACI|nr:hypothetical protein [Shouchella xiaoxiensis]